MEPIRLSEVSEKVVEKIPQWPTGWYLEVTERISVDQFGHQWHSFHSQLLRDDSPAPFASKDAGVPKTL